MRVLFATSEVFPLIKTGGLADVSGSLPTALQNLGVDIRILVPGYPSVLKQLVNLRHVASLSNLPVIEHAELMIGMISETKVNVLVIKAAGLYERDGGPYVDVNGQEWLDNPVRFGILSKVAAIISGPNSPIPNWQPDIVHCNDWQTGLAPAYMKLVEHTQAKSVISLHNMAFQGCYAPGWLSTLALPHTNFAVEGFEYHGQLSFLKAGIFYADAITTVSPSYAKEIQTAEFGFGLEGLLSKRGNELKGILNGIETDEWNPEFDPHLIKTYSANKLAGKKLVKSALQERLGLQIDASAPLLGVVSRLTHQKGLDMLVPITQELVDSGCQLALLGSGESTLENAFRQLANSSPNKVSVTIGYNEPLSHQIMAGCDMFIMPSRFEPCGLNQLYGLAYGTPPIVNATGGLADSVVDTNIVTFKNKTANGFVMSEASPASLLSCIKQALNVFNNDESAWRQIQKNGMLQNLSWDKSALEYLAEYKKLMQ
ncbi:glycogen synthase GlgA [Methylotenera sp.]|uniref:glycogen synthase GlgA n=1 Tax=Methylotenera sp. TaxID=2051956 RepID=UPI0027315866|nr:glycogen synthase GlgA [Methylotenera sp.]MDP2072155.1 glycogen synthase GlgA [Methylotenera sp.]MDP3006834.1 glycogen synthase GlgA [Methylotenera sp.]MDP3007229.1 glycogen synthase GlgA [Methylotenera sp.]